MIVPPLTPGTTLAIPIVIPLMTFFMNSIHPPLFACCLSLFRRKRFALLIRKKMLCHPCQQISGRKQKQGRSDIKNRMHVGNLGSRSSRCQLRNQRNERRCHAQHGKHHRSDQIKRKMNDRRALSVPSGAYGSQNRRNAYADILTEQNIHRPLRKIQLLPVPESAGYRPKPRMTEWLP